MPEFSMRSLPAGHEREARHLQIGDELANFPWHGQRITKPACRVQRRNVDRHHRAAFRLVKTSAIGALAVVGGDLETAFGFIVFVRVHPVVEAGPLRVAWVEFFVGEFARVGPPPRLGGEAFQHARPAAPGVFVAIGMQAGEGVGDGAPCAEEVGFREFFEWRGERAPKRRTENSPNFVGIIAEVRSSLLVIYSNSS